MDTSTGRKRAPKETNQLTAETTNNFDDTQLENDGQLAMELDIAKISDSEGHKELNINIQCEAVIDTEQNPNFLSQIHEKLDNLTLGRESADNLMVSMASTRNNFARKLSDKQLLIIEDILCKFSEFHYNKEKQAVMCSLCAQVTQPLSDVSSMKSWAMWMIILAVPSAVLIVRKFRQKNVLKPKNMSYGTLEVYKPHQGTRKKHSKWKGSGEVW